jgi:hypothetical protein
MRLRHVRKMAVAVLASTDRFRQERMRAFVTAGDHYTEGCEPLEFVAREYTMHQDPYHVEGTRAPTHHTVGKIQLRALRKTAE